MFSLIVFIIRGGCTKISVGYKVVSVWNEVAHSSPHHFAILQLYEDEIQTD